jgi:hypothetical protein
MQHNNQIQLSLEPVNIVIHNGNQRPNNNGSVVTRVIFDKYKYISTSRWSYDRSM